MELLDSTVVARLFEYCSRRNADLSTTCVSCLVSGESVQSIFSMSAKTIGMLWVCAEVCVRTDSVFPVGLCSDCRRYLIKADDFRNRHKRDNLSDCSICMHCQNARSVFSIDTMETSLVSMLRQYIKDSACSGKGLCLVCHTDLMEAYNFRTRCQRTDTLLRRFQPVVTLTRLAPPSGLTIKDDLWEDAGVKIEFDDNHKNNKLENVLTESNDKKYKCETCNQLFRHECNLNMHKKYYCRADCVFRCSICSKHFETVSSLIKHVATPHVHPTLKSFKCDRCPYETNLKHLLNGHKKTHTKDKTYKCEACDKSYGNSSALRAHKKFYCGADDRFCCSVCNKYFKSVALLNEHEASPNAHPVFKCDKCPYETNLKYILIGHKKIHTEDKTHKCEACDKLFGCSSALRAHKKFCCGADSNFCCSVCNKNFKSIALLKEHEASPDAHPVFKGDKCPYETIHKCYLLDCRPAHKKEKFRCDTCKNLFRHRFNLDIHRKSCGKC